MSSENQSLNETQKEKQNKRNLPIAKNEDVEFSTEEADLEDEKALERAEKADNQ